MPLAPAVKNFTSWQLEPTGAGVGVCVSVSVCVRCEVCLLGYFHWTWSEPTVGKIYTHDLNRHAEVRTRKTRQKTRGVEMERNQETRLHEECTPEQLYSTKWTCNGNNICLVEKLGKGTCAWSFWWKEMEGLLIIIYIYYYRDCMSKDRTGLKIWLWQRFQLNMAAVWCKSRPFS